MSLLCSACCRSAGNKCKAHAVRAPPKPKTPESPLHRSQFKASTLTRPPEHEGGSRFGPLRIPDAKAPGTPERESHVFGGEAALVETGNASFGGGGAELEGKPRIRNVDHGGLTDLVHEMSVEGGNGEQVGFFRDEERDKKDPMEVDTESAGLAGATRQGSVALLDNASLRQRANNGASSAVLGTDAQEFERETASVSREEASNRAEDCGEQVGLSPAEMDALWNEEEAEGGSLLTQGTGEGGFSTPNDLLGANTFPNRGLPPLDSGPGLDKKPFGGQQGSVAGQAESPQSSAAEQELFLRISSQRSPFAASARQSPAFLSETPGPGFTQELASAAFASQFGTANSRTGPLPTSGGGADFYRQLAQTLTPRRAAAFASGIDGGLATGEPSRVRAAASSSFFQQSLLPKVCSSGKQCASEERSSSRVQRVAGKRTSWHEMMAKSLILATASKHDVRSQVHEVCFRV